MFRFLRNVSWRLVANVLGIVVSAAAFPLVARKLGVEAYGQLAVVTGFAGLVGQILGLRLWDAVVKFLAEFVTSGDAAGAWAFVRLMYLVDLGTALLILTVLISVAPIASSALLHRPLTWLFVLAGLQIFVGATSGVSTAILRVFDRFQFLSAVDIAAAFARAGLVLAFVFAGWGVAGAIIGYALTQAGQSLALTVQAIGSLRRKFAGPMVGEVREPLRGRLREIAGFLFNLNLDTYRKAITANADVVILGYFASASAVGAYKAARQLAGYVGQLGNPLYEAIYPEVARDWRGEGQARVLKLMWRVSLGVAAGLAAVWLGSWLWAAPVVGWALGEEYASTGPLFLILLATNLWLLMLWGPGLMYTSGRSRTHVLINLGSAVFSLLLMLVLAPSFGASGVAAGLAAQQVVWVAWLGIYLWARWPEIVAAR